MSEYSYFVHDYAMIPISMRKKLWCFFRKSIYLPENYVKKMIYHPPKQLTVYSVWEENQYIAAMIIKKGNYTEHIVELAVDEAYRQQHIASMLLSAMNTDAQWKVQYLHVRSKNHIAINCYKNAGYRLILPTINERTTKMIQA